MTGSDGAAGAAGAADDDIVVDDDVLCVGGGTDNSGILLLPLYSAVLVPFISGVSSLVVNLADSGKSCSDKNGTKLSGGKVKTFFDKSMEHCYKLHIYIQ